MNTPSEIYFLCPEYMWSVQTHLTFHLLTHSGNNFKVSRNLMDVHKMSGKLYTPMQNWMSLGQGFSHIFLWHTSKRNLKIQGATNIFFI